ncbi:MAG: DUF349 domain-containing protein [Bacteroidales bacterium]|nr:DUF349 domain-containing protein [Bacteroidales bacterium]MBR4980737.1 DUF349 domain-containing protein [Bacteroidales bacterium]
MEEKTTALNAQESETAENQQVTEPVAEQSEAAQNEDQAQEILDEKTDLSEKSLNEILSLFEKMIEKGDQQALYKFAEPIKAAFYKVLRKEKIASGAFVEIGQADTQPNPFEDVEKAFKDLYARYKVSRSNFNQEMQAKKEENLTQKLGIIEAINNLLEKAEDMNHTLPTFRELQAKWKSIGSVPQEKARQVWDQYNRTMEKFYDFLKINKEFRDLDFKKNYEAKVELCMKAEKLVDDKDAVKAFEELQKLHEEWKELGPVSKDKREEIWLRFKEATSKINKRHQEYFTNIKDEHKANLKAKNELCALAEEVVAALEKVEPGQWNSLTKRIGDLQEKWKKIGFASKKDNQKVYVRFRTACDKFYQAKRQYYADFKSLMQENLNKKLDLCQQAEKIKDSQDWKKTTDQLINLQNVWKTIGPVARKQSEAVWKRFRAACDEFFTNKAKHFGSEDEKFDENLRAKKALIEEIENYQSQGAESDKAALEEFINKWNSVGFVPFKEKEALQKAYDEALNKHFEAIRDVDAEKKLGRIRRLITDAKTSGRGDRGIRLEREKLLNKFHKLETDIATLENNMGFFAKSANADKLIEEIKQKIEAGRQELKSLEQKIKMIDKEF